MRHLLLLLVGVITQLLPSHAQNNISTPIIGEQYPVRVSLKLEYENLGERLTLRDYKGVPLILDFFSSNCIVCFKALPKLNGLQQVYRGKMRFVLVGKEDANIRNVYERFRKQLNLQLAVAYDSVLHKDFRSFSYPLYIWIDHQGIVQAITGLEELSVENIDKFLRQESPEPARANVPAKFDSQKPAFVGGNGGRDSVFLSRAIFTKWNSSNPTHLPAEINYKSLGCSLQILGASITDLYKYAYLGTSAWNFKSPLYGDVYPFLLLEDGKILDPYIKYDQFNYSLWIDTTRSKTIDIQQKFKEDLAFQFGYEARVEYRMMPVRKLSIRKDYFKKLATKGGQSIDKVTHAGIELQGKTMDRVTHILATRFQREGPFINDSGIKVDIDLKIETMMTDFLLVKKALYDAGVELQDGLAPMRVIVLSSK